MKRRDVACRPEADIQEALIDVCLRGVRSTGQCNTLVVYRLAGSPRSFADVDIDRCLPSGCAFNRSVQHRL